LREGGTGAKHRLLLFFAVHGATALKRKPARRSVYLNVGHTGLNDDSLPPWVAKHQLQALHLIHDLIPITHPETCRPGERERHVTRMRNALLSASGIIGNSQATLDELATFAGQHGLAMPPSLAAWIAGKPVEEPKHSVRAGRPYFVVLGTIEPRKNHRLLLDVWDRLVAQHGKDSPRLLILGARGWEATDVFQRLDALGALQGHVEEVGPCSDEELTAWLAGAAALLMPSIAEGYGLPVFEALALGTPVIAADLPVYREVAGELPIYLAPDDVEGWTLAMMAVSVDGIDQQRRSQLAQYRPPTWPEHFAKLDAWLDDLGHEQSGLEPSRDLSKTPAGNSDRLTGRASANS
jgi:glycosyltransferase involved in cell wall biosynthesis